MEEHNEQLVRELYAFIAQRKLAPDDEMAMAMAQTLAITIRLAQGSYTLGVSDERMRWT